MAKEIYCLFNVLAEESQHQPNNNLVMWWSSYDPTEINNDINDMITNTSEHRRRGGAWRYNSEKIDEIVSDIMQGKERRIYEADYRLETVKERRVL